LTILQHRTNQTKKCTMQTKPWKFKHNQLQSGWKHCEGGWISFKPSLQKKNKKNLQKNNKRLGTKRTCIGRKTLKMDKWNNKLQGVINKLILSFTLQIWTIIQSTTFLSPNLAIIQSWKDHYHNFAQVQYQPSQKLNKNKNGKLEMSWRIKNWEWSFQLLSIAKSCVHLPHRWIADNK